MNGKVSRALTAGLRANSRADSDRWRACWCARVIVAQGREHTRRFAEAIHRDEDTVYQMARAARCVLEIYDNLRRSAYRDISERRRILGNFRALRRELPYSHFAAIARRVEQAAEASLPKWSWEVSADLQTAHETGAGVRALAGHTAANHSVVLPLWDAATVGAYLARRTLESGCVRFAILEGAPWEGVERVVIKADLPPAARAQGKAGRK